MQKSKKRKIKITGGPNPQDIRISIDGMDISNMVQSFSFDAVAGGKTIFKMNFLSDVDIECDIPGIERYSMEELYKRVLE